MTSSLLGMVCPSCRVALVMSERSGIEIDYCPECRGVWLDRGELDKIIDRAPSAGQTPGSPSGAAYGVPPQQDHQQQSYPPQSYRQRADSQQGYGRQQYAPRKKKE